jgi:hypothetical protein
MWRKVLVINEKRLPADLGHVLGMAGKVHFIAKNV